LTIEIDLATIRDAELLAKSTGGPKRDSILWAHSELLTSLSILTTSLVAKTAKLAPETNCLSRQTVIIDSYPVFHLRLSFYEGENWVGITLREFKIALEK
jgi:hypothetical protein